MFQEVPGESRMTEFGSPSARPRLSRRQWLELGAPALGLGLADLLRLRAVADPSSPSATTTGNKRHRAVIVFWTHGGMSQQDTVDLKPDAPSEYRGNYRPIDTVVPGIQVTEKWPSTSFVTRMFAGPSRISSSTDLEASSESQTPRNSLPSAIA